MFLYDIYIEVLFRPLLNALVFLVDVVPGHDIGVAIIILTIVVKLALWPSTSQSIKSQRALQEIQPELNRIKNKFKNDRQKQNEELMKFYKEHKVNPMASCLPLLIQLPILIALYQVFQEGLTNSGSLEMLYSFVPDPGTISPISFGLFDLSVPNFGLALAAGIGQFFQSWQLTRKRRADEKKKALQTTKDPKDAMQDMASSMTKQMMYVMPVITVIISMSLPSGLAFYWMTSTLISILQQALVMRKEKKEELKKQTVIIDQQTEVK